MSVQIHLDQHNGPFYTNLDFISGRVRLSLNGDISISVINVKLEGESRTRLAGPKNPHDRPDKVKTEFELHKLLYKVQTVFPSQEVLQHASPNAQFTLGAGVWEYPFKFKFPFNSDCKNTPSALQDLKFGQLNVQFMQGPTKHLKRALPPSLGGFPGEADIKYFVKVTVVRPKFYHENLRVQRMVNFLPIEPPRPKSQAQERYARRHHQFQSAKRASIPGLFKKSPITGNDEPLGIKVDARLPNPAILTCHQPIPLRILVEKTTPSQANIYLSMFHIELIAFTQVKANTLTTTEISTVILVSHANMDMVLGERISSKTKEVQIPSRLWDNIPLPNTVIPSFETCNLSRRYELEVRVGLTHSMVDESRPEMVVLPLRIPCQVYSGIMPPQELLHRMNTQAGSSSTNYQSSNSTPLSATSNINMAVPPTPITPIVDNAPPPSVSGSYMPQNVERDDPDDLPPSYEDAMAEDIGPVDGPRQHFETSIATAAQRQQPTYRGDSKSSAGGGLNRHPSERLFAQNAPRAPGTSPTSQSLSSGQTNTVYEEPSDDDDYSNAPNYERRHQTLDQSQDQIGGDSINAKNNDSGDLARVTRSTAEMNINMNSEEHSEIKRGQVQNKEQREQEQEPQPPPLPTRQYSTQ